MYTHCFLLFFCICFSNGIQKKVRGHTVKSTTWKMSGDTKIVVTFNKFGKPVGEEGNELMQFLGTLVRMADHVGIQYDDWRKFPIQKKEDMYSIVKVSENYNIQSSFIIICIC